MGTKAAVEPFESNWEWDFNSKKEGRLRKVETRVPGAPSYPRAQRVLYQVFRLARLVAQQQLN